MRKREDSILERTSLWNRVESVSRCEFCVLNILDNIIEEVNEGTIQEGTQIYLTSEKYSDSYAVNFLKGELGKRGYNGKFNITRNDDRSANGKRTYKLEDYE